ncbi:hypothetical protein JCM11251_003660 [Rhodosporidiobolus azoricus]
MVDRAALDARLHAHLHCHLTNDHSVCDELLRPLPHSRHSARSSFIGGPGPVWTGGLVVEGVPTPPRSPLGDVAQLYPPPPHLTPSASPLHSPPRTASPTRPMCGQRSARMRPLSASGSPSNGHSPMFDEEHEEQGKKAGGAVPSTDVWGHLKVEIVEAKDLAVEDTSKPYVLLQYDRTDSVSREWGAPSASSTSDNDGEKKRGANGLVRRRQANNGGTTTRRVVGGSSTTSTSTAADPSPVASAFGSKSTSTSSSSASTSPTGSSSHRTSTSISSLPSQSLPLPSSKPPKYNPSLTLRPVSPSPPSLPPEVIGTARSPIWHHHATFDVIAPGRTVLVCVYDKLAPQGGDEKRFHGFAGACVFEPPLLEDVGDEAEEEGEGEGPRKEKDRWVDVWVPLTSALDETIGGEIRLRILFEPMQSRPRLSIADFQLLRLIGQGSFGSVFRVRKRDTKRIYALKVIRKAGVVDDPSGRALQQVWTERKILEGNNMSPFLCGLKFSFQDERAFFFALDYKAGGEMFQHLQRDGGRFEEAKVRFYVAEIVLALGFLHDRGIVYRDLKPENCLLDGSGHVVLCDFGLSKILDNEPEQKTRTLCGTTSFLAPEVLLDVGYSYPSDFWSLGVLLFEMCFGWSPFYAENRMEEYERILSMEIKIPNKKGYGEEVKDLLRRLLERDVPLRLGARTGAAEIHSHPFFSPIDWPRLALRQLPPPFKPPTHADDDQPDWNDDGRQWRFDLDLGGGGGYYESHARGSCGGGGRKSVKSGANLTRGFTYHLKEDKQKWWDKRAEELWGGGEGKEAAVQEEGEGEGNENGVGGRKKSEVERFKQGEMDCGTRRSSCG